MGRTAHPGDRRSQLDGRPGRTNNARRAPPPGVPPPPRLPRSRSRPPQRSRAADAPLAPRLAQALAVPEVASASTAGLAVDLRTGDGRVRAQRGHLARSGLDREARGDLRAAGGARPRLPHRHRGARRRARSTERPGAATSCSRATATRRSRARGSRGSPPQVRAAGIARVTGAVVGDESFFDSRPHRAGLEGVVLRRRVAAALGALGRPGHVPGRHGHQPRAGGRAAPRPGARAPRASRSPARRAPASPPPRDLPLATFASPPLARIVTLMDRESDNFTAELLLKELGALYGNRGSTSAGAGSRAGAARATSACRSPGCASSTARGSRCSTASPRRRSSRSSRPRGSIRTSAPRSSRRCRSRA